MQSDYVDLLDEVEKLVRKRKCKAAPFDAALKEDLLDMLQEQRKVVVRIMEIMEKNE